MYWKATNMTLSQICVLVAFQLTPVLLKFKAAFYLPQSWWQEIGRLSSLKMGGGASTIRYLFKQLKLILWAVVNFPAYCHIRSLCRDLIRFGEMKEIVSSMHTCMSHYLPFSFCSRQVPHWMFLKRILSFAGHRLLFEWRRCLNKWSKSLKILLTSISVFFPRKGLCIIWLGILIWTHFSSNPCSDVHYLCAW